MDFRKRVPQNILRGSARNSGKINKNVEMGEYYKYLSKYRGSMQKDHDTLHL
jgi:hypothetical protein